MKAEGTFTVTMHPDPPSEPEDGVTLGGARVTKVFEGGLVGTSTVQMLSARTATKGSAGYVACERIQATLAGKKGTFVAMHLGIMDRGADTLTITIVPDSGSGDLVGIRGTMSIRVDDGQHRYGIDYAL